MTILAKLSPGSNARSARGNGGIFIPPDVVPGRRIFFLVDNVDFAEDTPDGKRTLHGTAMAIFQKKQPGDVAPGLRLVILFSNTNFAFNYLLTE